jgi:hypothetical protein
MDYDDYFCVLSFVNDSIEYVDVKQEGSVTVGFFTQKVDRKIFVFLEKYILSWATQIP